MQGYPNAEFSDIILRSYDIFSFFLSNIFIQQQQQQQQQTLFYPTSY